MNHGTPSDSGAVTQSLNPGKGEKIIFFLLCLCVGIWFVIHSKACNILLCMIQFSKTHMSHHLSRPTHLENLALDYHGSRQRTDYICHHILLNESILNSICCQKLSFQGNLLQKIIRKRRR